MPSWHRLLLRLLSEMTGTPEETHTVLGRVAKALRALDLMPCGESRVKATWMPIARQLCAGPELEWAAVLPDDSTSHI